MVSAVKLQKNSYNSQHKIQQAVKDARNTSYN